MDIKKLFIILAICGFSVSVYALGKHISAPMSEKAIEERTAPMRVVDVADADMEDENSDMPIGQRVYQKYCSLCHDQGVAGAPKLGSPDWKPRIAKGMDALLNSVVNGLGAMPPKGTCINCTNEDLQEAINHMVEEYKAN